MKIDYKPSPESAPRRLRILEARHDPGLHMLADLLVKCVKARNPKAQLSVDGALEVLCNAGRLMVEAEERGR